MSATLTQILSRCQPSRGWQVIHSDPPQIIALDGGPVPTLEEIEAQRATVEAWLEAHPPAPDVKIWPDAQAFINEFTMPEMVAISLSVHPVIAGLRLLLASWRSTVHANDERVLTGLDTLVSIGILTPERRSQLLT